MMPPPRSTLFPYTTLFRSDDVPPLALLGLIRGELPRVDETLHQALILGELNRLSPPHEVCAAVTDLGEVELASEHACGSHRGAHSPNIGVLAGVGVDLCIGELDRLAHAVGKLFGRGVGIAGPDGGHVAVDQIGGHGAGQLTGGGATHAVRNDEERSAGADFVTADIRLKAGVSGAQIRNEEGVLVVIAGAAEIGLAEDADLHRAAVHALLRKM